VCNVTDCVVTGFFKDGITCHPPGEDPNQFAIFIYDIKTGSGSCSMKPRMAACCRLPPGQEMASGSLIINPSLNQPKILHLQIRFTVKKTEWLSHKHTAYDNAKTTGHLVLDGESVAPQRDSDKFVVHDLQLTIVKPDGTSRKILRNLQSQFVESNEGVNLWYMRPQWSKDCQHLFYARICGKLCYIGSYDIEKPKELCTHI